MNFLTSITTFTKALLRGPLLNLRHWSRHYQVMLRHPTALVSFPIVFQYDDISAIKLGNKVIIGPFSEIVVYQKSSYSGISGKLTLENHVALLN